MIENSYLQCVQLCLQVFNFCRLHTFPSVSQIRHVSQCYSWEFTLRISVSLLTSEPRTSSLFSRLFEFHWNGDASYRINHPEYVAPFRTTYQLSCDCFLCTLCRYYENQGMANVVEEIIPPHWHVGIVSFSSRASENLPRHLQSGTSWIQT